MINTFIFNKMTRIILAILIIFSVQLQAQELWNLSTCVDYAVENNIDLNIKENFVLKQEINLSESKANLFPDLNLGSSLNFNYGRNIDGETNDITYNQTVSNNLWVSSSLDIFQGLVKQNTIQFNKYLLYADKEERELIKNSLIFDVITAYYISLYSIGLVDVAQNQVELSEMQYQGMQKLVDVGKESQLSVQDLKSQWVADKLNLTKAENLKNRKRLELKQLLRLNASDNFELDTNNIQFSIQANLPIIDSLYNNAIDFLPEIKQQEYLLNASKKDLAVSRGLVSPRLYMLTGLNTNYFDGNDQSYAQQLANNQNQQIRLGLFIPIFNNASTHSSIIRKKIAVETQQLQIEKQKELVYAEIWKYVDNTISAEKEYLSSLELYKFSHLSLQNTAKRLENGIANTSEYEIAKQRFLSAKIAQLKSELTYLMYKQILDFYKNGNWEHIYR